MPFIDHQGARHYYRHDGPADRPALLLSHSLGLDHGMWDPQVLEFLRYFQLIRYDTRGHGASDATPGDYTIEQLGRDALAVADAAGVERFAFCGLSLGGMIGMWLAVNAPDRLTHLVLANTSPRLTDPAGMEARRQAVVKGGMAAVVETVMARFFSPAVLEADPPFVATVRRRVLTTDPVGYAACCAAIRDMDQSGVLGRIQAPVLVVSGDRDAGMPWEQHGHVLATGIPTASAIRLRAAHISNLEQPRTFAAAVLEFLVSRATGFDAGMAVRRAMLGAAHVDRSMDAATDLTRDFQELITKYVWGEIWTRPALEPRTRRLLVLIATAALGRWEEFRLHVRAGLAAELELSDLKEALLQLGVYAGVPAANTAFHIAAEEHARARTEP